MFSDKTNLTASSVNPMAVTLSFGKKLRWFIVGFEGLPAF